MVPLSARHDVGNDGLRRRSPPRSSHAMRTRQFQKIENGARVTTEGVAHERLPRCSSGSCRLMVILAAHSFVRLHDRLSDRGRDAHRTRGLLEPQV